MARDGRNPSIDRVMPILRLPAATDAIVQNPDRLKDHLEQTKREIETHWHPKQPVSGEDAVSLGLPRITLSGVLDTTTLVPTYTAVGNSLVVRVKIAARTDRYPTPDEVRAQSSDTTQPFTRAFAAIQDGETSYAAALGYDAVGNESNLAIAHLTAGTAGAVGGAPIWLFAQRATGYWKDRAGTLAAINGDGVDRWDDQSGNARHLLSHDGGSSGLDGTGWAGGLDYRPILDENQQALRFGLDGVGTGTYKAMRMPLTDSLTEIEVIIGVRAESTTPTDSRYLWQWTDGLTGSPYPDTSGHVQEIFGLSGLHDGGVPSADITSWQAYGARGSNSTRALVVQISGTDLINYALSGSEAFSWNDELFGTLGPVIGYVATPADKPFHGWVRDLVIFNGICSTAQRASWISYILGDTDIPPNQFIPSLSYKIIGGDVEITATAPGATTVKIATDLSGSPTDADVRAATALTAPFVLTMAAPEAGETLYVGAFAYDSSSTESARSNLTIPGGITVSTSEGDLNIVAGDGITVTVDGSTNPPTITISSTGTASLVPTLIASGDTYTIPANKQALFKLPIDVEGDLIVRGDLLEVN